MARSATSAASMLEDPYIRMVAMALGGALVVALAPSILKGTLRFTARTAFDVALKAAPIVIAALLAKEGAEKLETA